MSQETRHDGRKIQQFELWASSKGLDLAINREGYISAVTKYWFKSFMEFGEKECEADWGRGIGRPDSLAGRQQVSYGKRGGKRR